MLKKTEQNFQSTASDANNGHLLLILPYAVRLASDRWRRVGGLNSSQVEVKNNMQPTF